MDKLLPIIITQPNLDFSELSLAKILKMSYDGKG